MAKPERQEVQFDFDCDNSFRSSRGLQQHKRRYCRGVEAVKMRILWLNLLQLSRKQIHMKRVYPAQYNVPCKQETAQLMGVKTDWAYSGLHCMVTAEVRYTGKFVNLLTVVLCTIDAIKGKRKSAGYQRLLASIRENHRRSDLLHEDLPLRTNTSNDHTDPPMDT